MKTVITISSLLLITNAYAEMADVLKVKAQQAEDKTWAFEVTVKHADTGWKDYANGWDVLLPDGTILKLDQKDKFTRTLWHPHVNEQPFTRSQSGLSIPDNIKEVTVKAHTTVDGWGGEELKVSLDTETSKIKND
ncbi:MAG TPA: hypothetical protein EYG68_06790 [Leucothrix mucor]|nr:hypothetical protein [Leucothrix mucor]